MKELEAIKARAEAATPGPWRAGGSGVVADREYVAMGVQTDPDADFIAHARMDIPKLLDLLEAALTAADAFYIASQDVAGNSWERGYNGAMAHASMMIRQAIAGDEA